LQGYSSEKVSVAIYEVTQATVEARPSPTYVDNLYRSRLCMCDCSQRSDR